MYKFKKISSIFVVFFSGILLFGCGSKIKEKLDIAIKYVNSEKYNEAKSELDGILKEDPNNSEAKLLVQIIEDFENAKNLYDNGDFNKANEELLKIPKDYNNYNIKQDIESLKNNINKKLSEIKEFNSKIKTINKLINDGKLNDAKRELDNLKNQNLTNDESQKVNDLFNLLNKNIDKKNQEEKQVQKEKQLKEKKKLEQKKKLEVNIKKKTTVNKSSNNKKESYMSKKDNNTKKIDKKQDIPYVYKNKELGLEMTIPSSWKGLYKIESDNNGIYIWVKPQKGKYKYSDEGFLFSITKYKSKEDEEFEDTVGSRKFITAKGIKYIIGGPTGATMERDNPDWNIYLKLEHEKYLVADSLKAIN